MRALIFTFFLFSIICISNGQNICYNEDSLSLKLLDAIKSENFAHLQALQPSAVMLKKGFEKELKGKSEDAIQKMISENPKTKSDWNKIITEAKKSKVNLDKLKLGSVLLTFPFGNEHPLAGMEVTYLLEKKTYKLSIAVVRDGSCLYFNEFLNSGSVWE